MSHRAGFTLLEVCLAVLIALFLVTLAVPSVGGLLAENRMRRSFDALDDLAREAQTRSTDERRSFVIEWERERVVLRPEEPANPEEERGLGELPIGKDEQYAVEFPAALEKEPPPVWTFWPTGTCEPVVIRYDGAGGKWIARYDPLTVRAAWEMAP
jgi:type II secretory pathway pseudopilin PulG